MSDVSPDEQRAGLSAIAVAGIAWAIFGGLVWSYFDARELATGVETELFESWTAAVVVGVSLGVVLSPVGAVAGWWWHRSSTAERLRAFLMENPASAAAAVIAAVSAGVVFSWITFGSLELYRQWFGSERVHQLAISITTPLCGAVLGWVAWRLVGPVQRLLGRFDRSGHVAVASAAWVVFSLSIWAFSLTRLGSEIWNNLSLYPPAVFAVITVFSVAGAILAGDVRLRRTVSIVAVVAVGFAGWHAAGEPPSSVRLAMAYGDSGTGWITRMLGAGADHSFRAAEANEDATAVCFPDLDRPRLRDVGRVDDRAPDIVWLTVDALRWEHTSLGGFERDTTPNIARHATERAAVFERAYTPATSTRQAFRSLFTGTFPSMKRPPRASTWALSISEEQLTLAEFLSAAGYRTVALSSEDGIFNPDFGGLQGFDVVDESPVEQKVERGYSAPHTIDRIIEELEDNRDPNFVWSHLIEPHTPYRPGPDPVDFGDTELDRYHASMRFADEEIDRLLEYVADRQSDRPTYLVVTSDHGEAFGEHGNHRHGTTTFEEETRVPLVVWGPDVEEEWFETPVSLVDLFSTTLELAGLAVPDGLCGRSLADSIRSGEPPAERPVYIEQVPDFTRPYFSVAFLVGSDKVVIQPHAGAVALYDLTADPGETENLADEQPERLERRLDELRTFWERRGMDPADYELSREP